MQSNLNIIFKLLNNFLCIIGTYICRLRNGEKGHWKQNYFGSRGFYAISLFCLLFMYFFMQQALHCCLVNCLHLLLNEAVY